MIKYVNTEKGYKKVKSLNLSEFNNDLYGSITPIMSINSNEKYVQIIDSPDVDNTISFDLRIEYFQNKELAKITDFRNTDFLLNFQIEDKIFQISRANTTPFRDDADYYDFTYGEYLNDKWDVNNPDSPIHYVTVKLGKNSENEGYRLVIFGYMNKVASNNMYFSYNIIERDAKPKKIPKEYLEVSDIQITAENAQATANNAQTTANGKMDANNPVGAGSFSMGRKANTVIGTYSHAEGNDTTASGESSHAEGNETIASGAYSHAEGRLTIASGTYSHAEGNDTTASGESSHAEGREAEAVGENSHAEGTRTRAGGKNSHAEGWFTEAEGQNSHAEGKRTIARGEASHVEGTRTVAIGDFSHAEGTHTIASGTYSHAEGLGEYYFRTISGLANSTIYTIDNTEELQVGYVVQYHNHNSVISSAAKITAIDNTNKTITVNKTLSSVTGIQYAEVMIHVSGSFGSYSHIEGEGSIANSRSQHVQGTYNIADTTGTETTKGTYVNIVGNGVDSTSRSNAHTLDWNGNAWYSGDVYTGSTSGKNKDEGSKKLATEEYADNVAASKIAAPTTATIGQTICVSEVDNTGKPTAWEAVDLVNKEEWTLITDAAVEEEVQSLVYTFADTPLKKMIVMIDTPAASADTTYCPVVIGTAKDGNPNFYTVKFYPKAIPTKLAATTVIVVEFIEVGENVYTSVETTYQPLRGTAIENIGSGSPITSHITRHYVDAYKDQPYPNITRFSIETYATFPVGTTIKIIGVRA